MSQNLAVAILKFKRDDLPFHCFRVAVMNADDLEYVMNPKNQNREKFIFKAFNGKKSMTAGHADALATNIRLEMNLEYGIHRIMGYELEYWFSIVRKAHEQLINERFHPNVEDCIIYTT